MLPLEAKTLPKLIDKMPTQVSALRGQKTVSLVEMAQVCQTLADLSERRIWMAKPTLIEEEKSES